MAITTLSLPETNSSVHDDQFIVVQSDNTEQIDFKYVIDVYATGKQLIRVKIYPDPKTSRGYFNFANVVRNEMVFDWFDPNGNIVMKELNTSGEISTYVQLRVGEDYSGTTFLNLASGEVYLANIIPNLYNRKVSDTLLINPPNPVNLPKFLSNRPRYGYVGANENFYIGIAKCEEEGDGKLCLIQYNANNATIGVPYFITLPSATDSKVMQLDIGEDALTNYGSSLSPYCTYYDILYTRDDRDAPIYDRIRIYRKCNPKYESINLHFMNNYGVFDSVRFDLVSRLTMDVENKTFEKNSYRIDENLYYYKYNDNGNYIRRIFNETKINYHKNINWTYKLTMNPPTDEEYQWLAELMMSPLVYTEIKLKELDEYSLGEKNFYPVTIKNTNYEYSTYVNNRLRPLELEIEMNQKRHGFRR